MGLLKATQSNTQTKPVVLPTNTVAEKYGAAPGNVKEGTNFFSRLAGDILNVGLDAGEAPGRVYGLLKDKPEIRRQIMPPTEVPVISKFTGPLQSYSSKIAQAQKEGESQVKPLVDFALNEPAGIAVKPVIAMGGLALKPLLSKLGLLKYKEPLPSVIEKTPELSLTDALVQNNPKVQSLKDNQVPLPNPPVSSSLPETVPQPFDAGKYVEEQVGKREAIKRVEGGGLLGKTQSFLADAKTKLVDFTAPIEDTLYAATKKNKIKLAPSEDIHNQIDRTLRAPTLAGRFADDNGLAKAIQEVEDINSFDQYLIAKHTPELEGQGIKTGRDILADAKLVESLGPKYEKQAQDVYNYSRKLLDYSVDSGLISKQLADDLVKKYPNYIPFQRVFSEAEKSGGKGGTRGVASLSRQTAVQKIKGSEREVESPLESLLAKTDEVFRQGEKNKAAQLLASYEKLPDNPFQLRELVGDETAPHTISFFENGVKRTFETTKEVAEAAKALNVQQLSLLGRILSMPVRVARMGLTGMNIPFIATNIIRDQISAFINSNKALKTSILNPSNFLQSLFGALKHNELYDEMVRAGGGGTSFDISRNQAPTTLKSIRSNKDLKSKAKYLVKNPQDLLRAVEDIIGRSEEFTRLQQFRGIREAKIAEGVSPEDATVEAARAARDTTVNFMRRGEWGTVLNSTFLYLNSGIQGTRTLLRNLKEKPLATASKIAISTFLPMAYVTSWNLKDEKRKEVYMDIPEYEKQNNIIIIPENPTQDEDGKWNVIKIPLPPDINNLVGLVRRGIESSEGLDPIKFQEFSKALLGTVSPIKPDKGSMASAVIPQAIKPTLESYINKNIFTNTPIVPRSLEGLSPENQVKPTTSGSARIIAEKLGVSPLKVEAWIKSTFGGVGSQAVNAVDQALASGGIIPKEQIGGQSILEGITARFQKAAGGAIESKVYEAQDKAAQDKADYKATKIRPLYDQAQALIAEGRTEEANAITQAMTPADYEIYKSIKTSEKTKATQELVRKMTPLAIKANKLKKEGKVDEANALTKVLTPEEYKAYLSAKKKLNYE